MALVDEIKSQESGNGQSIVLQRPSLLIQHISEHGAEGLNQEYVDTALTNGLGFGATAAGVKKDSDGKINLLYNYTRRRNEDKSSSETSATPAPGSVQEQNLEFLSQYQQENSLLARLKKAGQAAISGIKDAVASNTDAQRALYEAGQSGRDAQMQEEVKEIEENLARARRDYDQLLQLHNGDTNDKDVKAAVNVIDHYETLLSAYKKAPEAQRGATEETSKLADEIKKSAEKDIERAKQGRNNFERFLLDATAGGTQLLGDIGAGALTGAGAMPSLALRTFGGGTQQARQAGASLGQQIGFGAATATVEMLTEKMADGLAGAFGKGAADDVAEEVIRRLATTPAGQTALRTLYGMGGEGVEEVVSEIVSPALKAIYDKGESAKESYGTKEGRKALAADALYSGLLGAALGAPGSAVNIATGRDAQENVRNQELTDIYGKIGTPNVGQAVKDRGILESIRGGKDYGNLSVGDQANEAMDALRGRTPESVRAGQLSEARNRLFEMQQQRAAEKAAQDGQTQAPEQITPRSAGTQRQQENRSIIANMLDSGRVSNTQANAIVEDSELADAFKELTGVELSGTVEEKRQQVRDAVRTASANRYDSEALARQAAEQAEAEEAEAAAQRERQAHADAERAAQEAEQARLEQQRAEREAEEPHLTPEQSYVRGILLSHGDDMRNDRFGNASIREILHNPKYREAFEQLTGIELDNRNDVAYQQITDAARNMQAGEAESVLRAQWNTAQETPTGETTTPPAEQPQAATAAEPQATETVEMPQTETETAEATPETSAEPAPEPAPQPGTEGTQSEQSAGIIPASEQTTADSTNGSGPERERGFSANVATDQAMDKPLQESFQDNPDTYRQLTNKETLKKAQDIFNENKEDARNYVISALAEARNGRKLDPVIVPLARMVANDMSRSGNVDGARSILSDLAVELTAAGQLGQAAKILRDADPNTALKTIQKALDRINKEAAQKGFSWQAELTAEERNLIENTDFTQDGAYEKVYKQISKRVGSEMPATVWEKLNEIRRINMLLRPRTVIKNFASNVPMVAVRKLSEAISARIQGALVKSGKLDAGERTRAVASKESKQLANDYFTANKEDILSEGNKWDLNSMLRGDRTIFKDKLLKNTAIGRAVSKMTDKEIESFGEALRQVTYNLLERGDAPFVKSAFVDSLAQFCEAQGITDQSKITQEAIDFAKANAMEATFKAANTVAKAINQLKNNSSPAVSAAIDIILPFTTTPANIMNLMGQYSPIGFANMLGNKSIADKVDAFSKAATGSALMALGFMLRQAGFITGGEDDDKDKAALDRATGNAAYSIGGRVSYDWIQPVGSLFALGAEISDAVAGHEGLGYAVMNAIYTTGDSVLNMSMFQNILSVLKGKGSSTEKIVDAIMEGGLTQLMPGLAGDIAKIIDGTVRSTYTGGNAIQSSIAKAQAATPGASMLLPPSMNVKGEENTRGNLLWRFFSQTLIPFNVNIGTKNAVDDEIYRLYDETGSNTHFPNVSPYKVESDGQSYKMDGDERAKYQETQGQTYYKLAEQAINSKAYKAMTAEQQQLVLHNIASYASSEAKAEFLSSKGQKLDSTLSKLYSGVGSPGDSDYVPALDPKNAGEYIAFDTAYKKAVNAGNYAALDSLLTTYGKMSGNAQEVLTANNPGQNAGFGVKRLLEMQSLGISAADYSGIRQAQKDAKEQYGLSSTTGSTAKLFALATAPLSKSQKQKLFESEAYGISETVKSLYGILSQYGYDYQDTAKWMYNADYDNKGESNGTLSQVEVIRALERTKDIPNKEAVYQQMKEAFRNEQKINSYYEGSYQSELDYYNRNGWKAGRETTGNALYDYYADRMKNAK